MKICIPPQAVPKRTQIVVMLLSPVYYVTSDLLQIYYLLNISHGISSLAQEMRQREKGVSKSNE